MSANPSISAIINQLNLQSRLFKNVLADIKSGDTSKRVADTLNHVSWQAGHIVFARYNMAGLLGIKDANPYGELYANFKPLDPAVKYPTIEDAKIKFDEITAKLMPALESVTDDQLAGPLPFKIPFDENNVRGMIAFISHHEAYHIGQLGVLRRSLGYEPMKY